MIKKIKKNKKQKVEHKVERNKICSSEKQVIKLILDFKNVKNDISCSTVPLSEDNLYITFLRYIDEHRNGDKLPKSKTIEKDLNISARVRKDLAKRAFLHGYLKKQTENSYRVIKNLNEEASQC